MSQGKSDSNRNYRNWWTFIFIILVITIITGGIVLGLRHWGKSEALQIILPTTQASTLEVHISGAIANEGIYTFNDGSSINDMLQGAGGVTEEADLTSIEIHIPTVDESLLEDPQKVNINRAEAWLLEALPEIGPTLAQRIIDYRESSGPFNTIDELTNVSGIGSNTLDTIRDYIIVVD